MKDNDKKPNTSRSADDYALQQEDIRATQTFGETSLDRGSDRQHHTDRPASSTTEELGRTTEERERAQGVEKGSGKPI
jgi:hypothetical protein